MFAGAAGRVEAGPVEASGSLWRSMEHGRGKTSPSDDGRCDTITCRPGDARSSSPDRGVPRFDAPPPMTAIGSAGPSPPGGPPSGAPSHPSAEPEGRGPPAPAPGRGPVGAFAGLRAEGGRGGGLRGRVWRGSPVRAMRPYRMGARWARFSQAEIDALGAGVGHGPGELGDVPWDDGARDGVRTRGPAGEGFGGAVARAAPRRWRREPADAIGARARAGAGAVVLPLVEVGARPGGARCRPRAGRP